MCLRVFLSLYATVWVRICFSASVYMRAQPPWWRLLALPILWRGRHHFSQWQATAHAGWPRVSRLIVSGQSLSSSSPSSGSALPPTTGHGPCRSQNREKALAEAQSVLGRLSRITLPVGRGKGRGRDRHAKTKFNWFTAYMDQAFAHLFRSMSRFNQRAL